MGDLELDYKENSTLGSPNLHAPCREGALSRREAKTHDGETYKRGADAPSVRAPHQGLQGTPHAAETQKIGRRQPHWR